MQFRDLGPRNKGTFWEHLCDLDFISARLPKTKFRISLCFSYGVGMINKHCHEVGEIQKLTQLLINECEEGMYTPDYFEKVRDIYVEAYEEIVSMMAEITPKLKVLSNEELASCIEKAVVAMSKVYTPMLQGLYTMYLNDYYSQKLESILHPEEKAQVQQIKAMLLTTPKPSFTDREEAGMYEIIKLYRNLDSEATEKSFDEFTKIPEVQEKTQALVVDFGWFHMEYAFEPATYKDYVSWLRTRALEGIPTSSPVILKQEIQEKQKLFFRDHSDAREMEQLTSALQEFAFLLDHTKEVFVHGRFVSQPLFLEAAGRLGVTENELLMLTAPEITKLLIDKTLPDKKLIEERKQFRAVFLKEEKISVYSGQEAKELAEKLLEKDVPGDTKEVKGIVAYPGIVTGKATVVHSIQDKERFKKGDILVTHDGSAELTLFLKTASAIVTDQGGMICHAAIVAREVQTPCIVGTRNATKIIKDGDRVEVDANKGVVKIIE